MKATNKKSKKENTGKHDATRPGLKLTRAKAKRIEARNKATGDILRLLPRGAGGKKSAKFKAGDDINQSLRPVAGARNKGKRAGIRRTKPRTEKHPVAAEGKPLAA